MYDDFAPKLAAILTEFSLPIQPGDYVAIAATTDAEPLIVALYEAVIRRGGNALVVPRIPGLNDIFYDLASDEQLDFSDPIMLELIKRVDVLYQVLAPSNTKALTNVDPARIARHQKARQEWVQEYFRRMDEDNLRWNICAWPTQAAAQEAEMGLLAYTEFMYRACRLDQDDPVALWQAVKARQDKLVAWLKDKKRAVVSGPGIDLTFEFEGRLWISDWGDHNFPAGEIFTSPVETSVNGRVAFNFPTVYGGREINGVTLTFKDGKVVEATAAKGEDYLKSQLALDEGASLLGEFAIGTNYGIQRFTGETLFDEKIGGTVHMALGQGFTEANGVNKSQVHWDMVHDMKQGGQIEVDGTLIYQDGAFVIEG